MLKLEQLNPGTKLKVVKNIYYIPEDSISECEYLTYEELMDNVSHLLVKDDVYEVLVEHDDVEYENGSYKFILCIKGIGEGETNDGWFDVDEMIEKGALEILS